MTEPTDPGSRIEYAVRYDAPAVYAGIVSDIRADRSIAAGMARQHSGNGFRCTVVERRVTFGEWTESAPLSADQPGEASE